MFSAGRTLKSLGYALKGLHHVLGGELNFRIQTTVAVLVVITGFLTGLTAAEWSIIVLAIFLVLALETVNSAIEKLVDLVSPGRLEKAGLVKDISAGAVLLAATGSVIAGLVIFLPKIFKLI